MKTDMFPRNTISKPFSPVEKMVAFDTVFEITPAEKEKIGNQRRFIYTNSKQSAISCRCIGNVDRAKDKIHFRIVTGLPMRVVSAEIKTE